MCWGAGRGKLPVWRVEEGERGGRKRKQEPPACPRRVEAPRNTNGAVDANVASARAPITPLAGGSWGRAGAGGEGKADADTTQKKRGGREGLFVRSPVLASSRERRCLVNGKSANDRGGGTGLANSMREEALGFLGTGRRERMGTWGKKGEASSTGGGRRSGVSARAGGRDHPRPNSRLPPTLAHPLNPFFNRLFATTCKYSSIRRVCSVDGRRGQQTKPSLLAEKTRTP